MCGRYVLEPEIEDFYEQWELTSPPGFALSPSWNIAPTSEVPILLERYDDAGRRLRELHPARWGLLPRWAEDRSFSTQTFNARSETVLSKPSFSASIIRRRCAVPASAYYEWNMRRPYAIRRADGSPLLFAGIYEWWRDPEKAGRGESAPWVLSCSILTGPRPEPENAVLSTLHKLHERIPLALDEQTAFAWISPGPRRREQLEPMLERLRSETAEVASRWEIYEVGPAVGNIRNDSPELLNPLQTFV